jgi:hypothetical protein
MVFFLGTFPLDRERDYRRFASKRWGVGEKVGGGGVESMRRYTQGACWRAGGRAGALDEDPRLTGP